MGRAIDKRPDAPSAGGVSGAGIGGGQGGGGGALRSALPRDQPFSTESRPFAAGVPSRGFALGRRCGRLMALPQGETRASAISLPTASRIE